MTAPQIAAHLIALRQAGLTETGPIRRRMSIAYGQEVAVWGAWLQTHPDALTDLLHLLVTDAAQDRAMHGLPVPDVDAPTVPADPDVLVDGPGCPASLDRVAAQLAAFRDWTITATLDDGSTVTARPPLSAAVRPADARTEGI